MSYPENEKKADNIIKDILDFCTYRGFPKEFWSDNGPEFNNSKINEIWKKALFLFTVSL